ncbi:MAG: hypothetical protein LM558_02780 [Thermosphaera sp.]|nr:hypothetical protein [Thermosphaera sp.]
MVRYVFKLYVPYSDNPDKLVVYHWEAYPMWSADRFVVVDGRAEYNPAGGYKVVKSDVVKTNMKWIVMEAYNVYK